MIALLLMLAQAAAPMTFQHQGRILDASGVGINTEQSLSVQLVDGMDGELWSEVFVVTPEDGYYSVQLGGGAAALDSDLFLSNDIVSLVVGVGGSELSRQRLVSVPYAAAAASVSGTVQLQNDESVCTDAKTGRLRWDGTDIWVCVGAADDWRKISSEGGFGTMDNPGDSCLDIKNTLGSPESGAYWIRPFATSYEVWCDMTTAGGGWTLVVMNTINGTFNGSLDRSLSSGRGFLRSMQDLPMQDVMFTMGTWENASDWVTFDNVGAGNRTLRAEIEDCCTGLNNVDYNSDAQHPATLRSASLSNVAEVAALSLRMSQTSGPNDGMFLVVTVATRAEASSYNPQSNRWVSNGFVGAQIGYMYGNYQWSNWQSTAMTDGCSESGFWSGASSSCTPNGGVFVR